MATLKITEERAFLLLRRASQQQHRRLREIADGVVETGIIE
jgi:AmiR/NasT family two-component response regulator